MRAARVLRARAGGLYRLGRTAFELTAAALPPWELPPIPGPVSRADLMLSPSLLRRPAPDLAVQYDRQGREAASHLAHATGTRPVRSVLDLGCGHGRVLRHLTTRFPDASITAVDTDPRAVAFCGRHLGATAAVVPPDPRALPPGPFDLVWMGSVVTHLDGPAFAAIVEETSSRLAPGGVLAFSTLDPARAPDFDDVRAAGTAVAADGFTYVAYPYSPGGTYGLAFAAPAWVERAVAELALISHAPQGWDGTQDLWAFRAAG